MDSAQTHLTDLASEPYFTDQANEQAKANAYKRVLRSFPVMTSDQVDDLFANRHSLKGSSLTLLRTILALGEAILDRNTKVVEGAHVQPALFDLAYCFNTDFSTILAQLNCALMHRYCLKPFRTYLQRAGWLFQM